MQFLGWQRHYYYNARFYDPNIGRFITEDPARSGINWQIYALDNPLRYTDPFGLWVFDAILFQVKGAEDSKNGGLDFSFGVGKENPLLQFGAGTKGASLEAGLPHVAYAGVSADWSGGVGSGVHTYMASPLAALYADIDSFGLNLDADTLLCGASVNLGPRSYVEAHTLAGGAYLGSDAAYAYWPFGGGGYAWGKDFFSIQFKDNAPITHLFGLYGGGAYQGGQMEGSPGDPAKTGIWRRPRDPADAAMLGHDQRAARRRDDPNFTVRKSDKQLVDELAPYLWDYNPYVTSKANLATAFFNSANNDFKDK